MKNIHNSMAFYVMYYKIMYKLRSDTMKSVKNDKVEFRKPFHPLDTLVDQLHFLNRVR